MRAAKMTERPSFQLMVQTDVQSIYHMQMPRWLFSDPRYCEMSLDAKVTYTFLLNRFQLSRRNGWVNERGEVFVIFPRKALAKELRICEQRVTAAFKKLVELELVWEKRCGRGDANQIYLAYVTPQDDPAYASAPFTAPEENCGSRTADPAPLEGTGDGASAQEPQELRPKSREMRASRNAESAAPEPQNMLPSKKEKRKIDRSQIKVSPSCPAHARDGLTDEEREEDFLDILDELREKCPWDRKQTNESLRPNTIEETYELCDALMKDDKKDICKELGDVLLHVAFYAKIGSETGDFDIKDVCDRLCEKLIFRHPHVFGEVKADTAEKVTENWEQLKMKEKDGNKMVLSGVPSALPSLIKAYRIQDKARNVGFDWEERSQVWSKVKEEIGEFEAEVENMDKEKAEAEFGDVMFSLINAARLYKINPDNALEHTNQKFIRRFNYLEEHTIKQGKELKNMTLEEMDAIWNEAKSKGL